MPWTDTREYYEQLEQFLKPLRDTVFWDGCWYSYTDIDRYQSFIDMVRPYTSIEGKSILDSGCGGGPLLLRLLQEGAADLVGIELDPNIYRLVALRTAHVPQIQLIHDDASLVKLESERFDIIFSLHVIEHVADYKDYLRTTARLLKPGGVLLIACPNRLWPFEAHSRLPLINYLPRQTAQALGRQIESIAWLPQELRDRARTSTLYETDFTYFGLKRLLALHGLEILEMNHPRFLLGDLAGNRLGWLARLVQRLSLRNQWYLSIFGSLNLTAICRKL